MCGISGVLTARPEDLRVTVDAQIACLEHRGPDASGAFVRSRGAVAQNRLAIIDLATGDPPLTNEDGSIGAVLNGEIYNYRALRERLLERGHVLSSAGDTETLAHLAEEHDAVDLARRLDGMFAFAVYDAQHERLVLGRDRFGKKPLYYWSGPGRLVFASEIKGVLADARVPRELDPGAIPAYLTFGYVPTPRTFFAGIRSLPPGHVLTCRPGGEPRVECFWEPPLRRGRDGAADALTLDEAAGAVRTRMTAAVRRRLESDVPLGAFLSGGIDSSAVVACATPLLGKPLQTFTIGFEDRDGYDEREFARAVAARFGTDHHEFVVKPDAVELVERLVWHHDHPFGDSSAIPTYLLAQLTRGHVTVALSGDGGDELFAGYSRFANALRLRGLAHLPRPAQRGLAGASARIPERLLGGRAGSARRLLVRSLDSPAAAFRGWISYLAETERRRAFADPDDWALRDFEHQFARSAGAAPIDRLLDLNIRTYLLDDLLVKADRMSMAHALEVRSPFLDTDLADLALRLAPATKTARPAKQVLRRAFPELPPKVVDRKKRGFGVPLDRWFRDDLRPYLMSMLGTERSRVRAHLAPAVVDDLLAQHAGGRRNHGHALWMLLTLEVFLREQGW
jgi:asparagine synthase (glutamine-hydrolysing)